MLALSPLHRLAAVGPHFVSAYAAPAGVAT